MSLTIIMAQLGYLPRFQDHIYLRRKERIDSGGKTQVAMLVGRGK